MTTRIVVVDDQVLAHGAIAMVLDLEEDIEVVVQAGNGREAIEAAACNNVGVVLADVEMSVMDGTAATSRIRKEYPNVKILMITTLGRPGYLYRAMEAGISGFVVKDAPSDSLASTVCRVVVGQCVVDPGLVAESLAIFSSPLAEREQDALRATSDGGTIADVSRSLSLSQGTVRNYLSLTIHRTGARIHAEAVVIIRDNDWL